MGKIYKTIDITAFLLVRLQIHLQIGFEKIVYLSRYLFPFRGHRMLIDIL